jgi:hypothetical protein
LREVYGDGFGFQLSLEKFERGDTAAYVPNFFWEDFSWFELFWIVHHYANCTASINEPTPVDSSLFPRPVLPSSHCILLAVRLEECLNFRHLDRGRGTKRKRTA